LANPAPIIRTFYLEPDIADELYIDAVVTLVDAKHAERHINEVKPEGVVNEAVEQIAYADRIILNKVRGRLPAFLRVARIVFWFWKGPGWRGCLVIGGPSGACANRVSFPGVVCSVPRSERLLAIGALSVRACMCADGMASESVKAQ
jgi:hypothetical protein